MKKLIFALIVACLFSFSGFSQGYEPMLREGAQWVVSTTDIVLPWGLTSRTLYFFTEDTIISNQTYRKLISFNADSLPVFPFYPLTSFDTTKPITSLHFLREDSVDKKVYIRFPGLPDELLLYDFNLAVSDTVKVCLDETLTVTEIENRTIGNSLRRIFILNEGRVFPEWTEGVGSQIQFLYPCFSNGLSPSQTVTEYCNPTLDIQCPYTMYGTSALQTTQKSLISMAPNPFESALLISLPEGGKLIMFCTATSLDGRVYTIPFTQSDLQVSTNTENLPNGVYIITVTTKEGNQYRAKGVKY